MNEVKLFSATAANSSWRKALEFTSISELDAKLRMANYSKMFSAYETNCTIDGEIVKQFSGVSELPVLTNQFFDATVASYVRSFAGFLSIERTMNEPTALLGYLDLVGVTDGRKVLPNLGPDNLNGIQSNYKINQVLTVGTAAYTIATNRKLIPGMVTIQLVHAADPTNPVIIRDDAKGNLLAPAGVLAPNAGGELGVDYRTGVISMTLGAGFAIAEGDVAIVIVVSDVPGDPAFGQLTGPGNNRFKLQDYHIIVATKPDMLEAEGNILAYARLQKSYAIDANAEVGKKLTELYVKLINKQLVAATASIWRGNVYEIDLTTTDWNVWGSYLDQFEGRLEDMNADFAEQANKVTEPTAYVVGKKVGAMFCKLTKNNTFVKNTDSTYVNDLLGYYNGVPVLRHLDIADDEGYAVAKTRDGQLAPVMRGIYLPLTATPTVGNYNNTTQFANGVYYQEANEGIVPELVMKFKVKMNANV
jgi:hypothetical protein